jgi:hypothetical protein
MAWKPKRKNSRHCSRSPMLSEMSFSDERLALSESSSWLFSPRSEAVGVMDELYRRRFARLAKGYEMHGTSGGGDVVSGLARPCSTSVGEAESFFTAPVDNVSPRLYRLAEEDEADLCSRGILPMRLLRYAPCMV